MDGRTLLQRLMANARENPNSLARKLNQRSLQSQLQRFLEGKTTYPRASTMQPVADHYGIDVAALLSEEAATRTAIELKLLEPGDDHAENEQPLGSSPRQIGKRPISDIGAAIDLIANVLGGLDGPARRAIGSLLSSLADHPEDGSLTANRICALIAASGNVPRPKSSASPPSAS